MTDLVPRDAFALHKYLNDIARSYSGPELTKGQKGALIGACNRVLSGDRNRHFVLAWVFSRLPDHFSTKQLTNGEWFALWSWIGFIKDEDTNQWMTDPRFPTEAYNVLTEAFRFRVDVQDPLFPPQVTSQLVKLGGQIVEVSWEAETPAEWSGIDF